MVIVATADGDGIMTDTPPSSFGYIMRFIGISFYRKTATLIKLSSLAVLL
jgi:hypothetical protein